MNKLKAYKLLNKALTKIRENDVMVELVGFSDDSGILIHISESVITDFHGDPAYSLWNTGLQIIPKDAVFNMTTGELYLRKEQEDE